MDGSTLRGGRIRKSYLQRHSAEGDLWNGGRDFGGGLLFGTLASSFYYNAPSSVAGSSRCCRDHESYLPGFPLVSMPTDGRTMGDM